MMEEKRESTKEVQMKLPQGKKSVDIPADIVAYDRNEEVILAAQIKAPGMIRQPLDPEQDLLSWAIRGGGPIPYYMVANTDGIHIVRSEDLLSVLPAAPGTSQTLKTTSLNSSDVLGRYDREFPKKAKTRSIYEFYLTILISG